jgi:hypothetical protein
MASSIVQICIKNDVSETALCLHPQAKSLLSWTQSTELVLSIGSNWVGFLPEDGDKSAVPETSF